MALSSPSNTKKNVPTLPFGRKWGWRAVALGTCSQDDIVYYANLERGVWSCKKMSDCEPQDMLLCRTKYKELQYDNCRYESILLSRKKSQFSYSTVELSECLLGDTILCKYNKDFPWDEVPLKDIRDSMLVAVVKQTETGNTLVPVLRSKCTPKTIVARKSQFEAWSEKAYGSLTKTDLIIRRRKDNTIDVAGLEVCGRIEGEHLWQRLPLPDEWKPIALGDCAVGDLVARSTISHILLTVLAIVLVLATFSAIVVTIICCWSSSADTPPVAEEEHTRKMIKEVPPVKCVIIEEEGQAKPGPDPSIISVKKTINPFTGEEMWFTNRHKQVKANAGIISRESLANNKHKPKRKLFKHHSENYICGLMRTPLGMPIVRGRLPNNFDDDFVKSYAEEIKIEPEDTDEDIALKQAMIDFKKEVKDQIANGASVSEIVLEAREEQNKLAEYRKNLMRTIADLRREGATREELNDAREAANVMLDNKGLKRIPTTDLPRKGEDE